MSLDTLLAVLADGHFHSGDELGKLLGVSRTAVWKQLKKIEELNLPLLSIKGKGYCLDGGLDLLNTETISASLSEVASRNISEIEVFSVVDSTNTKAMAKAVDGVGGYVCSAEQQTTGKGRRGRPWFSPYASNIYLSVVWEFPSGAASLEGLSLAVGVAVVDALAGCGISGAQLKWPNDVLYDGKKLAGILLEMVGDPSGPCHVVVGIGLNVAMPHTVAIDQPWIDVRSIDPSIAVRSVLFAAILNELMPLLTGFEEGRFISYRNRWQSLDAFSGREVTLILGKDVVVGRAVGVDEGGAILVDTDAGRRAFNGGEISLRLAGV